MFIDSSFLMDSDQDKDNVVIVEAVCRFAYSLGIASAIDGVHTDNQKALLKSVGCQLMSSKMNS